MGPRHGALAAACMLSAVLLAACGGEQSSAAQWRASHPDPAGLTFDESAPGICALTPQFGDEAPAAIDYMDGRYIQKAKAAHPASAPGTEIATSADWKVSTAGGELFLLTPSALFTYQKTAGC